MATVDLLAAEQDADNDGLADWQHMFFASKYIGPQTI